VIRQALTTGKTTGRRLLDLLVVQMIAIDPIKGRSFCHIVAILVVVFVANNVAILFCVAVHFVVFYVLVLKKITRKICVSIPPVLIDRIHAIEQF
jgi:hypothetical protein